MTQTEKQKMLAGELYWPEDPELQADLAANKTWMAEYNSAFAASAMNGALSCTDASRLSVRGQLSGHRSFATMASTSASAPMHS